jgi:hypothetical protein
MFTSICSSCSTFIQTHTDQSQNSKFCCKKCQKRAKRTKQHAKEYARERAIQRAVQHTKDISMDDKYGPKVISGWSNYYLSFILPTSWINNDVRCNRCYKRFTSPTVPDYCASCTEYYPVDLTCIKCNKIEHIASRSYKKHNDMCIECFNSSIFEFKCDFCNIVYDDTHNSFNMLNKHVCLICRTNNTYKKQLLLNYDKHHNELIDTILQLHYNIFVEITYKVEHCNAGYCYYHDNYYTKHENDENIIHSRRFPLMKIFDYSNLSNLVSNQDFIDFYSIPDESRCENGCEYLSYTITSVS